MTSHESIEFGIFTGSNIYQNAAPKEPIIEGMFDVSDNLVISSKPGVGKSILGLQLICNLTTGSKFLDTFIIPKPRKVLYVQTEGDRAETLHRLRHMTKALKIDDSMWAHYNAVGITLNTTEGLNRFLHDVLSTKIAFEVIMIDPLYATVKGSLNSDEVATDWQRSARIIREKLGRASYIVWHHEPSKDFWSDGVKQSKPKDDLFGSTMWGAWMSANYKMVLRDDGIRVLQSGKGDGRGRTGQGVSEIHLKLIEPTPLFYVIDDSTLNETEARVWGAFVASPSHRFRRVELDTFIGKSKPTTCRALNKLIDEGKIETLTEEGIIYYVKR